MEITIKDKTYKVKYSVRAMLAFEQLANKSFEITNLTDLYIFCYCMVLAGMNEEPVTFDDFIDACDENHSLIPKLSEFMDQHAKVSSQGDKGKGAKKKTRKV